jgi:PAS domain S-box-containing protein
MTEEKSKILPPEERERLALLSILEDERQMRQQLKEQEERYRTLVESLNEGLIQVDNDDRILFANQRFFEMSGYAQEELTGKIGHRLFFDPGDWEVIKSKNQQRLDGKYERYEIRLQRKDGRFLWVLINASPVYGPDGSVVGSLGAFSDITQEKEARQQKELLHQRNQLFVNSTNDLVFLKDSQFRYLMVNEANRALFDKPLEEILGKTDYDLMPKEAADSCRRSDEQALDKKRLIQVEERVGNFVYSVTKFTVPLEDGAIGVGGIIRDITQRVKYEEAIRESAHKWKITFDAIKDGVCLLSADQTVRQCNLAFAEFLGKPFREIVGRKCHELVHSMGESIEKCPFVRMRKSRKREHMELQVNGRIFDVLADPIIDEKGELVGAVHILSEITEHKKILKDLSESEERFRSFYENTFVGIYRTTPEGKILMANPALVKMLGYRSFEELSERNLENEGYISDEERQEFKRLIVQADQVIGYETRWKKKDGAEIWVRENVRCVRNEKGDIFFYEGTVEDITGQKQSELALRESEEKYRLLVESLNDMIFSISVDGLFTYMSPAVSRMSLYRPEEIIGRKFSEFIYPEDIPEVQNRIKATYEGKIEPAVFRVVDKDGSSKHVRTLSRPMIIRGETVGLTGIMTDISGQVKLEEEKKIIEEELRQSQKLEAIGQLAGGVAHDFNNMLAGILGNAELLMGRLSDRPEMAKYVENIIAAAENAARLTKNLLAFSRRQTRTQEVVDIRTLVDQIVEMLGRTSDRRIRIETKHKGDRFAVMGDKSGLANMLMNLGINSRDAMPQGGRLVYAAEKVRLDKTFIDNHGYKLKPGDYVKIEVSDTGCGMTPEVKGRMYDPFFTTKEPGKGTGLGLAMVYGTVREHRGIIDCYSEPGRGTTMKIYLPLCEGEARAVVAEQPAVKASRAAAILIVDDEEMVRAITEKILESAGHKVLTCGDAEEAVRIYKEKFQEIDLVILDMIMPKMSGREVFMEMKKINPEVKAILSSGFSEDSEAKEILKLGISGFVQKPFHVADLLDALNKALG